MTISRLSTWKDFFLNSTQFDYSNFALRNLRDSIAPSADFSKSFEEISKNPGISFISLDPTETKLQLFHHPTVVGGSWNNPNKKLIAVIGHDLEAKPVQIVLKSIKDGKGKSHSLHEFSLGCGNLDDFKKLRNPKTDYHLKNIVPIPILLTNVFMSLPSTEPEMVAIAFFEAMFKYDNSLTAPDLHMTHQNNNTDVPSDVPDLLDTPTDDVSPEPTDVTCPLTPPQFLDNFLHVLQFCHLCSKGKISPVLYAFDTSIDTRNWYSSIMLSGNLLHTNPTSRTEKHMKPDSHSDDDQVDSPASKISRRDHYFINTMLKLHESVDKSLLRTTSEREEKDPGFNRLEPHKKNLILNASATPPYETSLNEPTEFYTQFLSKKTQFKAKEMLLHRLSIDNIAYNPNATFVSCLWNCEFLWLLPDSPSGISIFFCPESKSLNSSELERERNFALADKIKQSDLDKLSKQKLTLPTTIMDMVWMTQNLHAIVSLCFGDNSHSANFLHDWASHMYKNRLMYTSLQGTDPAFYAKVLFAIDNALQTHWKSCCENIDRLSVNDRVLMMNDAQDSILRHNFIQSIPKSIMDKVENLNDKKNNDGGQDFLKFRNKYREDKKQIHNNDKAHLKWRLQDGETFSKIFFPNAKKCPKTKDGKQMCMKFLIRGICDPSCTRAHKLSTEDEKAFDKFFAACREENEGAMKPDF